MDEGSIEFNVGSANTNPAPIIDANTTDAIIVLVFMAYLLFSELPLLARPLRAYR
jgi:hypothetical protein